MSILKYTKKQKINKGGLFLKRILDKLNLDPYIMIPYLLLSLFGLIMVYSASSFFSLAETNSAESYFYKQFIFVLVGMGLMLLVSYLGEYILQKKWALFGVFAILILLLIIVLFTSPINGAKSWISIGGFTLQPSEFAKLFIIWAGAYFYSVNQKLIYSKILAYIAWPASMAAIIFLFVLAQPDFGTFLILILIFLIQFVSSGVPLKYPIGLGVFSVVAYGLTYLPKSWIENLPIMQYQIGRLTSFHNPWADAQGDGYQAIQGYLALARGGLTGTGLATSIQKTGFLPEAHTDFILAIIGEEMGVIMVLVVLAVLFSLIIFIFRQSIQCKLLFSKLVCIGVGAMILVQSSINIGALLGLAPITGVPLPFISYGGSSFLALSIGIGMVQCVIRMDQKFVSNMANSIEKGR